MNITKLDLTLLNKLVSELNTAAKLVDQLDSAAVAVDKVVELSKAMGLAAGIATEATMLVSDIKTLTKGAPTAQDMETLEGIFGGLSKKKIDLQ